MNKDYNEVLKTAVTHLSREFRILEPDEVVRPSDLVWNWATERWCGFNGANHPLWDGARAIDYSRPTARLIGVVGEKTEQSPGIPVASVSDSYIKNVLSVEATNFDEQREVLDQDYTMRMLHASMGLTTEVGELMGAMKRFVIYGTPLDVINAKEELGDILWYLALFAHALGMKNFDEIMTMNTEKLRVRYESRFTQDKAANRDKAAEREALVTSSGPIFDDANYDSLDVSISSVLCWKSSLSAEQVKALTDAADDLWTQGRLKPRSEADERGPSPFRGLYSSWTEKPPLPDEAELSDKAQRNYDNVLIKAPLGFIVGCFDPDASESPEDEVEPSNIQIKEAVVPEGEALPMIDLEKTAKADAEAQTKAESFRMFGDLYVGDYFVFHRAGKIVYKKVSEDRYQETTAGVLTLASAKAGVTDYVIEVAMPKTKEKL